MLLRYWCERTFKARQPLSKLHESARKMFPGIFGKFGCAAILCAIVFVGLRALFQHAHTKVFFGATICFIGFIEIVLRTHSFKHYIFKHTLDLLRSLSDGGSDTARVAQSIEAHVPESANQDGQMSADGPVNVDLVQLKRDLQLAVRTFASHALCGG
jgi:hypothetical protein